MSRFDEAHRAALREAARRRAEDQQVGEYIRRCNSALFAILLYESRNPGKTRMYEILQSDLLTNGLVVESVNRYPKSFAQPEQSRSAATRIGHGPIVIR